MAEHKPLQFYFQEILSNPEIADVPVAVLVNKIDLQDCASAEEVVCEFDLYHQLTGKVWF